MTNTALVNTAAIAADIAPDHATALAEVMAVKEAKTLEATEGIAAVVTNLVRALEDVYHPIVDGFALTEDDAIAARDVTAYENTHGQEDEHYNKGFMFAIEGHLSKAHKLAASSSDYLATRDVTVLQALEIDPRQTDIRTTYQIKNWAKALKQWASAQAVKQAHDALFEHVTGYCFDNVEYLDRMSALFGNKKTTKAPTKAQAKKQAAAAWD